MQALERGVKASDILCLTFTNRAGLNMREKVNSRLGKNFPNLLIGNMHAFCFKTLIQPYAKQQRDLINEELQKRLLRQASVQLQNLLKEPYPAILQQLEHCLNLYGLHTGALQGFSPDHIQYCAYQIFEVENSYERWNIDSIRNLILPLISNARHYLAAVQKDFIRQRLKTLDQNIPDTSVKYAFILAVYYNEAYQQLKQHYHFYDYDYDYDDLIIDTLTLQNQEHAKRYAWVQIDEVQDLSPLHWLLIDHLVTADAHILILGDLNQSIYRFMGASVELTEQRLGKNVYILEENYRSPDNLVQLSNDYAAAQLNKKYKIKARANKRAHAKALQHLHRQYDTEQTEDLIACIRKANRTHESLAVLLSTNKQAEAFSDALNTYEMPHFFVAQDDLLTREFYLDFMAFISALQNPENRLAWARLLWRFGNVQHNKPVHLKETEAQFAAIKLVHELAENGCWLNNFLNIEDCFQHRQQQLKSYFNHGSAAFFDTETTGLNYTADDIIQIAAVTHQQELNLYCHTSLDLTESSKVHQISAATLERHGAPNHTQLHAFMAFNPDSALIAHNLKFDQAMLNENIRKYAPELTESFFSRPKFCSLELSRQLFPRLDSYKLGDLLQQFNLEGQNSHNALDDVKAGRSLLSHLVKKIEENEPALTHLLTQAEKCLNAFNRSLSPLWNLAQYSIQCNRDFKIQQLFTLYIHYIRDMNRQLYEGYAEKNIDQLQQKLFNHAQYHYDQIQDAYHYFDEVIPFYQTAKESDLITPNDHLVVSTIHRSKGLEFDHVILPDVIDQHFPSYMVIKKRQSSSLLHKQEAEQLFQEQQRLLYVAMTRAKKSLIIGTYNFKNHERGWKHPRHYDITQFLAAYRGQFQQI